MLSTASENTSSRVIAIGLASVTIAVFTQSVTDPVNVTKLFLLGGFAFAGLGASAGNISNLALKSHRSTVLSIAFFLTAAVSTLLSSDAPFTQSLYGVYGRNNGFILYLLLAMLFISTLLTTTQSLFNRILFALAVAGITNVAYALWVLAFGDFIGWANPYGNLLGTLGNPNFIGSFFGMFSALLFAQLMAPSSTRLIRTTSLLLLPLVLLGIVQSNAVQGKVLFIAGFVVASFYWVWGQFKKIYVSLFYLAFLVIGFIVALLGILQKGPVSALLYKESVSLRGEYWHSAWETGITNPIFGTGFDSFGDWYRRSRRESSLTLPGVDTVTNAAHNVFLDMFAFGGWPLFMSYLVTVMVVLISIVRFTIRNRKFDSVFVSLTGVWLCYQLQSTISINQIGLAIWGWAFGGAIIAYELNDSRIFSNKVPSEIPKARTVKQSKHSSSGSVIGPGLVAGLASIVGLIIAVPPLSADSKWRSAQISQSANLLEESLQPSYLNPLNNFRFINVVGVFETNGLTDLAHTYGLKAVEFNPNSYEAWRNLYHLSKSSNAQRALALSNMKRLDPLNPNPGKVNK
jgi:hypothetical protein